jgi:hypothetical protein
MKVIAITGHYAGEVPQELPAEVSRLAKPFAAENLLRLVRERLDEGRAEPA